MHKFGEKGYASRSVKRPHLQKSATRLSLAIQLAGGACDWHSEDVPALFQLRWQKLVCNLQMAAGIGA
jgi:hypothetical protein